MIYSKEELEFEGDEGIDLNDYKEDEIVYPEKEKKDKKIPKEKIDEIVRKSEKLIGEFNSIPKLEKVGGRRRGTAIEMDNIFPTTANLSEGSIWKRCEDCDEWFSGSKHKCKSKIIKLNQMEEEKYPKGKYDGKTEEELYALLEKLTDELKKRRAGKEDEEEPEPEDEEKRKDKEKLVELEEKLANLKDEGNYMSVPPVEIDQPNKKQTSIFDAEIPNGTKEMIQLLKQADGK